MLGPTGRLDPDVVARDEFREGKKESQMTRRSFASASVGERLLLLLLRALMSGSNLAAF
jgi:hypothetical protein